MCVKQSNMCWTGCMICALLGKYQVRYLVFYLPQLAEYLLEDPDCQSKVAGQHP